MLEDGGVDPPGLLVHDVVCPVRVDLGQLHGYPVVFPHEEGVHDCQSRLVGVPLVSRHEAGHPIVGGAAVLLLVSLGQHHLTVAEVREVHQPPGEHPQSLRLAEGGSVDGRAVDVCRQLVHLVPVAQVQLPQERAGEGETPRLAVGVVGREEGVVLLHPDGQTVHRDRFRAVTPSTVQDLVLGSPCHRGVCHLVVQELSELHDHVGELDVADIAIFTDPVRNLNLSLININRASYSSRIGKGLSTLGPDSGSIETVVINGRKEMSQGTEGISVLWEFQIITPAIIGTVSEIDLVKSIN